MTSVINLDADHLPSSFLHTSIQDQDLRIQGEVQSKMEVSERSCDGDNGGVCTICLDKIVLQETALIKGCEHAYCVTCILRWATYNQNPLCPQCKLPFEFLNVHRSLDGSIQDDMFVESVCLLLRATWFKPLHVDDYGYACDDSEDYFPYEFEYEDEDEDDLDEDVDDLDEVYFSRSSTLHIGNRRWGNNGYVRAGRQEARPVHRSNPQESGAGSSREPKKKEVATDRTGRRAKRTLKREAADKAAAVKHQQHLARLGRK